MIRYTARSFFGSPLRNEISLYHDSCSAMLFRWKRPMCSMKSIQRRADGRKVISFETRKTPPVIATNKKKEWSRKKNGKKKDTKRPFVMSLSKALEVAKNKARELLDTWIYPQGSFTQMQFDKAKGVIYFLMRKDSKHDRDTELVRLSWQLFQRVVDEQIGNDQKKKELTKWVYDHKYLHCILHNWAIMYKDHPIESISPNEILSYLQELPTKLPGYKYSRASLYTIFKTAMEAADAETSPIVGEEVLQIIQNICLASESKLEVGATFYRSLLQAWVSAEKNPEVEQKIANFLVMIRKNNSVATIEIFDLLMKFWGNKDDEEKFDDILSTMELFGVEPRLTTLFYAVCGYVNSKRGDKAESFLQTMMKLCHRSLLNRHDANLVADAAHRILRLHRQNISIEPIKSPVNMIESPFNISFADVPTGYYQPGSIHTSASDRRALESAEKLVDSVRESKIFDLTFVKLNFMVRLMDMYARAGMYEKADEILSSFQLRPIVRNIVTRLCGRDNMFDILTLILKKSIDVPFFAPTKQLFDKVIGAWGKSTDTDAVYQSLALLNAMEMDFECLDIQPDTKSYNLLLQCIGNSIPFDQQVWPAQILDEMDFRYQSGDEHLKPDEVTLQRAFHVSLKIGDMEGGVKFLGKMIAMGFVPTVSMYSKVLERLATSTPSVLSAKLADEIMKQMKKLEDAHNDFQPTPSCYAMAIKIWSESGARLAKRRIPDLRKKMKRCVSAC